MNKDMWDAKWDQIKGDLKASWAELTDDDVEKVKGDSQKLAGVLKEKYAMKREEAAEKADKWINDLTEKLK